MEQIGTQNQGFCQFCGQGFMLETVGEVTQNELDELATEKCQCQEAVTFRRKRDRRKKIDEYVQNHFPECMRDFVFEAISVVEEYHIDKCSFNFASRTCAIWMDADMYLHVKIKHKSDEELKV